MHAAAENHDEGAVYNIGTAARKSGLSVTTIRTWEDRYGAVVPVRDASGRRLYSSEQIAQLTWLRQQIDAGLRASEAHRLLISGETESVAAAGAVVDQGSPWATLLVWAEQEKGWIASVLADLRKGLQADSVGLASVIDNPLRGPVLSIALRDPEVGDDDPLAPLALVTVEAVAGLDEDLSGREAVSRSGSDFGMDAEEVILAPIHLSGTLAGVLVGLEPSRTGEGPALVERAVRVIESRIEA
ncbi:MAG: MerR family transcriptional regulator, partial [Actinomycetota bacterium]